MKVFINSRGRFLQFYEVSSHTATVVHSYSWVPDLDEASLAVSEDSISKLRWKEGSL